MTRIKKIVKLLPLYLQKRLPVKVVVVTITSRGSRNLNRQYRKKDKATNVLSFRYDKQYGEILICPEVVQREAREQGNSYQYQYVWMVVHGLLHCAGMHHERSHAAEQLATSLEQKILRKLF